VRAALSMSMIFDNPRVDSSVPASVIDAPVVLVWPPAAVIGVRSTTARESSSATSPADSGRATPSGVIASPEASALYAERTDGSVFTSALTR